MSIILPLFLSLLSLCYPSSHWHKQWPSFRVKGKSGWSRLPRQSSSHYFRTWEWVLACSQDTEEVPPAMNHCRWAQERVRERVAEWTKGVKEKVQGKKGRERDGGLSLRIYLSKTPTSRFFSAMNNSFLWQSIFLLICRREGGDGAQVVTWETERM